MPDRIRVLHVIDQLGGGGAEVSRAAPGSNGWRTAATSSMDRGANCSGSARVPFPACAAISQNGTMIENTGSWRPTIAESACKSSPVTLARVTSGVPSAPNATGAVLPMSASLAASSGRNPSPIISAPEIATGVPNPAVPSMNAPKLNASNSARIRRSRDTLEIWRCRTARASSARRRAVMSRAMAWKPSGSSPPMISCTFWPSQTTAPSLARARNSV